MTLESIRLFLESAATPHIDRTAEARARERATLLRAPGLAAVLPAAKVGYALKETHAYHIDYPGLLATREVLLGFGRRLMAEGRLDATEDVWMLRRDELRTAVANPGSALEALVAERKEELADGIREGPRPYLGEPPQDERRHATLEKFYGRGGGGTGATLRGTGASPGVADGPARVMAGPDDFARVRPGDVLVATTTTPAWTPLFLSIAALVTETGGILCHAAIVAREYGVPAVVGATGATRRIPDGATITVDGGAGKISMAHAAPTEPSGDAMP
jgi:pyruvate,water dikinase